MTPIAPPAPAGRTLPSERSWADSSWSARVAMGSRGEVTAYQYLDVWLVEVLRAGPDAPAALDLTVQLALAECPVGLVYALPADPPASGELVTTLARLGRHVARWPATPVVVVWADDAGWADVGARPDGRHLQRSSSLLHAWSQLHTGVRQRVASLRVPGNALAARAARAFLTRTCLDWHVAQHLDAGPLVVSELVTNAVQHTDGDVDVRLAEHDGRLRVAVRDRGDEPLVTSAPGPDSVSGRGLRIVETLAATSGALPAAGGGKVVWAVLDPVGVRIVG